MHLVELENLRWIFSDEYARACEIVIIPPKTVEAAVSFKLP